MVRVIGPLVEAELVKCRCGAQLSVKFYEWKDGEYGGEMVVKCPRCKSEVVKPGTEYQGDF